MRHIIEPILNKAGIEINGSNPWDIQVHDERLYKRVVRDGSLGLGESYMDGWWDCEQMDIFFDKILRTDARQKVTPWKQFIPIIIAKFVNFQTKKRSKKVAEEHYDVGNDLYKLMLDKHMQYTCGYWKRAKNLDQAQEHKLKLVCEKLKLKKGMVILELGGGFGGFAYYAAKHYGVKVVSYNISKEQVKYAREWCKGLPVKFILQDYREAKGKYDRVVSIGMCEHVGPKNYRSMMKLAHRKLKPHGIFLLHTIGSNLSHKVNDPWIRKYIFPGGVLPSVAQLSKAAEHLFTIEDWHNFGADYDPTLMAWYDNFVKSWPKIKHNYSERFYRMWRYYLLICAGGFRSRHNQLWQVVFSKGGYPGGYESVR